MITLIITLFFTFLQRVDRDTCKLRHILTVFSLRKLQGKLDGNKVNTTKLIDKCYYFIS